jgi:hypothetical protein
MKYDEIKSWAEQIAREQGFNIEKEIYRGTYYQKSNIRNIIFSGIFDSKRAVLKAFHDPRFTNEVEAHRAFLASNTSSILTAPQLYASKKLDDHRGWLIMEELRDGEFLQAPLSHKERKEFLRLYQEYRTHFPKQAHRDLLETEKLTADEFHQERFFKWKNHFKETDAARTHPVSSVEIENLINETENFILKTYRGLPLEWTHSHFKPQELFHSNNGKWYLTDFAHTRMSPIGYELAFIIWADQIMTNPPNQSYAQWKSGIEEWSELMKELRNEQKISDQVFRAALAERMLGSILMDFGSSDKPRKQIIEFIEKADRYLHEIINRSPKKQKKENQLLNILINVVIPTIILVKFSTAQYLGPVWGVVVALLFPLAYGIWDYMNTKDYNFFSIIGIISVFLTGGIAIFQLPPQWLAIKEAGVPFFLGLLILVFKSKYPFVEKLLHEAIDYKSVHEQLRSENKIQALKKRVDTGTYLVVASFLLSATLNYILAKIIVTSDPGTEAFAAELGKLTALSYPVIAIPSMIVMVFALVYIVMGIAKLTGKPLEELLEKK